MCSTRGLPAERSHLVLHRFRRLFRGAIFHRIVRATQDDLFNVCGYRSPSGRPQWREEMFAPTPEEHIRRVEDAGSPAPPERTPGHE